MSIADVCGIMSVFFTQLDLLLEILGLGGVFLEVKKENRFLPEKKKKKRRCWTIGFACDCLSFRFLVCFLCFLVFVVCVLWLVVGCYFGGFVVCFLVFVGCCLGEVVVVCDVVLVRSVGWLLCFVSVVVLLDFILWLFFRGLFCIL